MNYIEHLEVFFLHWLFNEIRESTAIMYFFKNLHLQVTLQKADVCAMRLSVFSIVSTHESLVS